MKIDDEGFDLLRSCVANQDKDALRSAIFVSGRAGMRCLLDEPLVLRAVGLIREQLISIGILPKSATAIQAIAFDKTAGSNWKVTWHQDVMFPFENAVTSSGFDLPTKKNGIDYARPPLKVLEEMTAVRLHLDDCDESNGPLRVAPKSHLSGVLRNTEIADHVSRFGEMTCFAEEGELLIMKPLLLHSSSQAKTPKHRRVLHIVFHSGNPIAESWFRSV
jgi:ectoine hydroxylase-related dioxygenase (phytanoyl-CoA dioxygenase family)